MDGSENVAAFPSVCANTHNIIQQPLKLALLFHVYKKPYL